MGVMVEIVHGVRVFDVIRVGEMFGHAVMLSGLPADRVGCWRWASGDDVDETGRLRDHALRRGAAHRRLNLR